MDGNPINPITSSPEDMLIIRTMKSIALLIPLLASIPVRAADDAQGMACPIIESVESVTRMDTSDNYTEISGLCFSPTQLSDNGNPIFFAVADGGAGPRLGVFDSGTGQQLLTLTIKNHNNTDWESLASGPCGDGSTNTCIYIADTGANLARESGGTRVGRGGPPLKIIKILEPNWKIHSNGDIIEAADHLYFDYKDESSPTPNADCEAIFVDYTGWGEGNAPGDLYLATKWDSPATTYNRIFKIPVFAWNENPTTVVYSPEAIGDYSTDGQSDLMNYTWTSADMSPDGSLIALGTNQVTHLFLRCPGESVESVLAKSNSKSCLVWPNPASGQGETFAFMPDGRRSMQIPEGNQPKIGVTKFGFSSDMVGQMCGGDTAPAVVLDATTATEKNVSSPPAPTVPVANFTQSPFKIVTSAPAPGPIPVASLNATSTSTTAQLIANTTDSPIATSTATAGAPSAIAAPTYEPQTIVSTKPTRTKDGVVSTLQSKVVIRVWPVAGDLASTLQASEEFENACSEFFRTHFPDTIENVTCSIVKLRLLLDGLVLDSTIRITGTTVVEGFYVRDFDRSMVPLVNGNTDDFASLLHKFSYYSKVHSVEAYDPSGAIPAPEAFPTDDDKEKSSQSSGMGDNADHGLLRIVLVVVAVGAIAAILVYIKQQHCVGSLDASSPDDTASSGDPVLAKC